MDQKYPTVLHHIAAKVFRARTTSQIADLVTWDPLDTVEDGCTAIIGVHRAMPDVFVANLRLLAANAADTVTQVIACIDGPEGCMSASDIARAKEAAAPLPIQIHYYSQHQSDTAERVLLPYVYSWLSWSICLKHVKTRVALFHDFDALILDGHLADRLAKFREDRAFMQCMLWYHSNGIIESDRLATTFEAFVDVGELRKFKPIDMFNQVGKMNGKRVDFDTLLAIQAHHYPPEKRTIMPVGEGALVHPSQMIHQYTMFRRQPGGVLPCFSVILLPFFSYLGGAADVMAQAADAVSKMDDDTVRLGPDEPLINLSTLTTAELHWGVKQMLQVLWSTGRDIPESFLTYVAALYARLDLPPEAILDCDIPDARQAELRRRLV